MDVEKLTKETLDKGGVLALLYFDLHADKKESLQQFGAALVQKILGQPGVVYAVGEIDEPMENRDLFSASVEVKILVKDLGTLAKICGNHSPFSVEILRPDRIALTIGQAHELLMGIAVNNYELKKTMLEKVYTQDDLEKFKKMVEGRLEVGKKMLEKK